MLVQLIDDPWTPILPHGFDILPMEQDGNCLYHSVSDQLFHDKGAGHVIVRHQINNHIRQNSNEFKNFLLINDSNLEITDVIKYNKNKKMSQDGAWAGQPEIYAAA